MRARGVLIPIVVSAALVGAPIPARAQLEMLGGIVGGAIGSRHGSGGAIAGAIIGVAMSVILQKLTEQEQQRRQVSLQRAARSGSSSWSSSGKSGKRASYRKVGAVQDVGGRKCQKVRETITLADGQRGTAEETVCFS